MNVNIKLDYKFRALISKMDDTNQPFAIFYQWLLVNYSLIVQYLIMQNRKQQKL